MGELLSAALDNPEMENRVINTTASRALNDTDFIYSSLLCFHDATNH
jgi:hypothetical protein